MARYCGRVRKSFPVADKVFYVTEHHGRRHLAAREPKTQQLNMAKALYKVQKQISKKRAGKGNALHVNSRDAQRLRAAGAREDKLSKLVTAANRANQSYGRQTQIP